MIVNNFQMWIFAGVAWLRVLNFQNFIEIHKPIGNERLCVQLLLVFFLNPLLVHDERRVNFIDLFRIGEKFFRVLDTEIVNFAIEIVERQVVVRIVDCEIFVVFFETFEIVLSLFFRQASGMKIFRLQDADEIIHFNLLNWKLAFNYNHSITICDITNIEKFKSFVYKTLIWKSSELPDIV